MRILGSKPKSGVENHGHETHIVSIIVGRAIRVAHNPCLTHINRLMETNDKRREDTISSINHFTSIKLQHPKRAIILSLRPDVLAAHNYITLDSSASRGAAAFGVVAKAALGHDHTLAALSNDGLCV